MDIAISIVIASHRNDAEIEKEFDPILSDMCLMFITELEKRYPNEKELVTVKTLNSIWNEVNEIWNGLED